MLRLFNSSVQKEFAEERRALRDWLRADPLMRRFFEPFVFEELPAKDRRTDQVYREEVGRSDLFLVLLQEQYGVEDATGLSPTHHEFSEATRLHKPRFVFIKEADDRSRHPKMQALIRQAEGEVAFRDVGGAQDEGSLLGTPPVTPPVEFLARLLNQAGELGNAEIRLRLGLKDRRHLRERYVAPALAEGVIEPTIPDKPNSRLQKYRLTAQGRTWLANLASPPKP